MLYLLYVSNLIYCRHFRFYTILRFDLFSLLTILYPYLKRYNCLTQTFSATDFDDSSSTDSKEPTIATPPDDVQIVIDKMASYVARNGDEFADIVRAKNDPRFTFLEPDNIYHAYYKKLMQQKRGGDVNGKDKKKKSTGTYLFLYYLSITAHDLHNF